MKLKTITLSFTLAILTACSSETRVADNTTKSAEPVSMISSLKKQYQQATEYLNTGRLDEARNLYEIVLKESKKESSPEFDELRNKARYGEALVAFQKWKITNDPNEMRIFSVKLAILCNGGDMQACKLLQGTRKLWDKE